MPQKPPLVVPPYNPLSTENVADSVTLALLARPPVPLPLVERFTGAGVYAIYYTGNHSAYTPLAEQNRDGKYQMPIYVGKAVPKGSRRGILGLTVGTELYSRLRGHASSIKQVADLDINDFTCRYLVVVPVWINVSEAWLIQKFKPAWNLLGGFGINEPGKGRSGQRRSKWDTIHPGRKRAAKLPPNDQSREELIAYVQYIQENPAKVSMPDEEEEEEEG